MPLSFHTLISTSNWFAEGDAKEKVVTLVTDAPLVWTTEVHLGGAVKHKEKGDSLNKLPKTRLPRDSTIAATLHRRGTPAASLSEAEFKHLLQVLFSCSAAQAKNRMVLIPQQQVPTGVVDLSEKDFQVFLKEEFGCSGNFAKNAHRRRMVLPQHHDQDHDQDHDHDQEEIEWEEWEAVTVENVWESFDELALYISIKKF
ncbi:hypothetical protein HDU98_004530 [Podochytrium sp. JEL0797]|nr:hypothetical protein HDU98_004530 [Podochytrium sp. JEL0797]